MSRAKPETKMKMPEFLVFVKAFVIGFVGSEVCRTTYHLGIGLGQELYDRYPVANAIVIFAGFALCLTYVVIRGAWADAVRMGRSFRLDLLMMVVLGVGSHALDFPWLTTFHAALKSADPCLALVALSFLCVVLLSSIIRFWLRPKKMTSQLYFLSDEEVRNEEDDLLGNNAQAKSFAEAVLQCSPDSGLVFGVEGPWGIGKTSFINLAERHWEDAEKKVIVCRFEPLRYASEPDLVAPLVRDLTAAIQSKVFAPEFGSAASRYSRLIRGKLNVSFLGFKLSLDPPQKTVADLLDDIDNVLRRIDFRVIIIIDDLERVGSKTAKNLLFATRGAFKIPRATYLLCYNTEGLANRSDEELRASEFLEKFVTVQRSLFVDDASIRKFLLSDWKQAENKSVSVPADTMVKLSAVVSALEDILGGELAADYLPLVGDMRKVKRFINAMLCMQIEKTDWGQTDFNKRDLINLMLLHLNYPGLFRKIYAEETGGRSGKFSVQINGGSFKNSEKLAQVIEEWQGPAAFLLKQLFDVETLKLGDPGDVEESALRSRACFNLGGYRMLESYLKLLVRFVTPEPQHTFVLYQKAVEQIQKGASIASVLTSPNFNLQHGEHSHDQFWALLVNQSQHLTKDCVNDAIDRLVEYLPRYSTLADNTRGLRGGLITRGLRGGLIYSLLKLLDRAGWKGTTGGELANTSEVVVEVARRIFGEGSYRGQGLLERLACPKRGALGWNDLMLFRLRCSADRGAQLYNLQRALIFDQDPAAETTGNVDKLALFGMRKLSQKVFAIFKRTYIDPQRNFLQEFDRVSREEILGIAVHDEKQVPRDPQSGPDDGSIAAVRSGVKSFVIYQLSNSLPPTGSGVGCGHYDEEGSEDGGGIAMVMNKYMFEICFNPNVGGGHDNASLFLDHCLHHLQDPFGKENAILGGLDRKKMGHYWLQHREHIRGLNLQKSDRCVFMPSYTVKYCDHLDRVFAALDKLADEAGTDS